LEPEEPQALGWEAIDRALAPLYEGQTPKHFGTLVSYELGGPDPIRGISAYKRLDPIPHWHFITYGFSELFEKESSNKEFSGWGFELTLRLVAEADSEAPPNWTLNFLQNLARYVFNSGNVFTNGDYLNANGPIALGVDTLIHSIVFIHDPELPPIETPNGRVAFLQVVGITNDEELAVKKWKTLEVLEVFKNHLPLLMTDLERASLLEIEEIRAALDAGAARDGSYTGHILVDQLAWQESKRMLRKPELQVKLGARQVMELKALLRHRIAFGRPFSLIGSGTRVVFTSSAENHYKADGSTLHLEIIPDVLDEIEEGVQPKEGIYAMASFPGLVFQVQKTHLKNSTGQVVESIG